MFCLLRQSIFVGCPGTRGPGRPRTQRFALGGGGLQSLLNPEGIVETLTKRLTWPKIQNSSLVVEVCRSVSVNTACSGERLPQTPDL